MGMLIYDALVLTRIASDQHRHKSVLTLGVPVLNFSHESYHRLVGTAGEKAIAFRDHISFFQMLGFSKIDSLDISAYEGATIIGDLNDPALASKIGQRYDLVFDCGTLEHIFDVAAALRTISQLVEAGGSVVHATPANGFLDHGFWQVSPDLFRTFYQAAGFDVLTSALFVLGNHPLAVPATENIYRHKGRDFIVEHIPEAIAVFAARQRVNVAEIDIAMQDYYRQMHTDQTNRNGTAFFIPYGSPFKAALFRTPILGGVLMRLKTLIRTIQSSLKRGE